MKTEEKVFMEKEKLMVLEREGIKKLQSSLARLIILHIYLLTVDVK